MSAKNIMIFGFKTRDIFLKIIDKKSFEIISETVFDCY